MAKAQDILLPDNDPDLVLAQQVGEALSSGTDLSSLNNPIIDLLVEFKDEELKSYSNYEFDSTNLWKNIEQETRKPANITPLFQRRIAYTWAAAAVFLIAAFVGFFWIISSPDTVLVAQSEASIISISLEDGTEVTLRPYSQLFEVAANENERSYTIEGEAYFDVQSDADRPFTVQAGQGVVTVLGTRFNLSSWGNTTKVYLEEGSISFNAADSDTAPIILEPGESSTIENGMVASPQQVQADEYTDWISNTIVFNSSLPADVVAEIGQHFNITIDVSQLEDIGSLTGSLRLDSVSQTLEDLGLVLGGTFRQAAENEYVFVAIN